MRRGRAVDPDVGVLLVVLAIAGCAAALPACGAVSAAIRSVGAGEGAEPGVRVFSPLALARSVLVCGTIASLATAIGLLVGWSLRRARGGAAALAAAPLLLPSYLAYSGLNVLRAPGTAVGDWLARGDPRGAIAAGWVIAIVGLALWSAPLAVLMIAARASRVTGEVEESLRLDAGGALRRGAEVTRMLRGACAAAWASVLLIMLGSAVPLHLAQIPTYAIDLWTYLSLTANPGGAWVAGWPLLICAVVGAIMLDRAIFAGKGGARGGGEAVGRGDGGGVWVLTGFVGVSVGLPLALQAWAMEDPHEVPRFVRRFGGAMIESVQTGAWVGGLCAAVCAGVWRLAGHERGLYRAAARGVVGVLAVCALIPGVLIGSGVLAAMSAAWTPGFLDRTTAPVVLAHIARFGVVGAAMGAWCARLEDADERGARLVDGPGLGGWVALVLARRWWMPVGAGLACGAMSLHEVESAVQLSPPGMGSLSLRVLELLHYARDRELSAASLTIVGAGLAVGAAVWGLAALGERTVGGRGRFSR